LYHNLPFIVGDGITIQVIVIVKTSQSLGTSSKGEEVSLVGDNGTFARWLCGVAQRVICLELNPPFLKWHFFELDEDLEPSNMFPRWIWKRTLLIIGGYLG
jgi:hypothetical protein